MSYNKQYIDIPYFIALHLIVFCRYCAFYSWRFVAMLWQVCWYHFSNSICSLHVSVSHFGNFRNVLDFFIIIIFVMVFSDLWYYYCNCFGLSQTAPTANLIDKGCVCSDCSTDWLFPCLSHSPQASLYPETQVYWNHAS